MLHFPFMPHRSNSRVCSTASRSFFLSPGQLSSSISWTNKSEFYPGEILCLMWKIENNTNRPIKTYYLEIRAQVSYLNRGEHIERHVVKIMKRYCGKSDIPFAPSRSSNTGGRYNLVIPKVPPSTSSCLISVQYSVVLHVVTAFGNRLEVELPVNIGKMVTSTGIMNLPPHTDSDIHFS
jgi:hypothetical protein